MPELLLWVSRQRLSGLVLAEESTPSIQSVTEHVDALLGELNLLQLLLKRKKFHQHTECATEIVNRVRRIEYLAYRMEDVIEKSRRRSSSEKVGLLQGIKSIFTIRDAKYTVQKIISMIAQNSEQIRKSVQMWSCPILPGIEEDKKRLLGVVVTSDIHESSSSQSQSMFDVIPIFGVIGSGKTTLAQVIFEDQLVDDCFNIRIWINMPDKFKAIDILQQIHENINGSRAIMYSEERLLEEISKGLKSQTSLIVLDDIRSIEAWRTLHLTSIRVKNGNKILVTTREESVAEYISEKREFHKMRNLNEEESWDLFTKVFSPRCPEERMVTVREMVRSCEGVPQLIRELGFYLEAKQAEEWEMVYKNIQAYVSAFFCTVYSELSDYLKPCFLHLGQFSEEQEIDTGKLFHFWMIDAFLSTTACARGERMVDLIERYLEELACINIVELQDEEVPTKKKFKAYSIVGGIKHLCISWGEQKHFLKIVDLRKYNYSLSSETLPPRLVVYLGNHGLDFAYKIVKNVRSLRIVGESKTQQGQICPIEMLNLMYFRVLRILDFDGIDFQGQKLPGVISDLVLLRYLSLKGCVLDELPSSIGKLVHLQVLDLRLKESTETIVPDVLWRMKELKHLYLPLKFRTRKEGEKLRLDSLKELETIVNFNTSMCKVNDVYEFLQYLAAKVEGNFDEFKSITSFMQTTSNNWFCASIDIIDLDCYAEERHSVLQEFLRCKVLQTLHFKGHIGHLPPYDEISQKFTHLVLNNSHLKDDPMPTFGKLPNLEVLVLSDNAYMGNKMVCSVSGFPQLKYLELLNLHLLERIEVENTAMPRLSNLKITNCRKYDHIVPDCLDVRSSNHQLKIILN